MVIGDGYLDITTLCLYRYCGHVAVAARDFLKEKERRPLGAHPFTCSYAAKQLLLGRLVSVSPSLPDRNPSPLAC